MLYFVPASDCQYWYDGGQFLRHRPRPDVVHSSLYLPEHVYEALREAAFKGGCKIHDLVMQGIEMALKKRGYPSIDNLKVRRKG